MLVTV